MCFDKKPINSKSNKDQDVKWNVGDVNLSNTLNPAGYTVTLDHET